MERALFFVFLALSVTANAFAQQIRMVEQSYPNVFRVTTMSGTEISRNPIGNGNHVLMAWGSTFFVVRIGNVLEVYDIMGRRIAGRAFYYLYDRNTGIVVLDDKIKMFVPTNWAQPVFVLDRYLQEVRWYGYGAVQTEDRTHSWRSHFERSRARTY